MRSSHGTATMTGRYPHSEKPARDGPREVRSTLRVSLAAQSGQSARRVCREEKALFRRADDRVLQQVEGGVAVLDVFRHGGIFEQAFYRWRKVCGGVLPIEARELKQLRDEDAKLNRLVADLSLDKVMLTFRPLGLAGINGGRLADGGGPRTMAAPRTSMSLPNHFC